MCRGRQTDAPTTFAPEGHSSAARLIDLATYCCQKKDTEKLGPDGLSVPFRGCSFTVPPAYQTRRSQSSPRALPARTTGNFPPAEIRKGTRLPATSWSPCHASSRSRSGPLPTPPLAPIPRDEYGQTRSHPIARRPHVQPSPCKAQDRSPACRPYLLP